MTTKKKCENCATDHTGDAKCINYVPQEEKPVTQEMINELIPIAKRIRELETKERSGWKPTRKLKSSLK